MIVHENVNIWDFHPRYPIVITTNMIIKKNGHLTMGKGLALEMKLRYPSFPKLAASDHKRVKFWESYHVYTFPTKYHWRECSDINLIIRGLNELNTAVTVSGFNKIYLPPLGCGQGGLNPGEIIPILRMYLDDRFTLVLKKGKIWNL